MNKDSLQNLSKLDHVTATIVYKMDQVGLFHYNKLTYLFEYFFIKNFGKRYTGEYFIKITHGPVIPNYKNHIKRLSSLNIVEFDAKDLNFWEIDDDHRHQAVLIRKSSETANAIISEKCIYSLIKQIIEKFGQLSVNELEKIVYKTEPMKNYLASPYKKKTGGYVLKGDCIKISKYKSPKTEGRRRALEHVQKYPAVDFELQKQFAKELAYLETMRPQV